MGIIKKVILYLINLFFTGFIPMVLFIYISQIFYQKKIPKITIKLKDFYTSMELLQGFLVLFIACFIVKYLIKGFIDLFFKYKDWYKESTWIGRVFITLGLIFVVYGVYYRATR